MRFNFRPQLQTLAATHYLPNGFALLSEWVRTNIRAALIACHRIHRRPPPSFQASMPSIVYAHGFKSSSRSRKATQLRDYLLAHHADIHFYAPDLSFDPDIAINQLVPCCGNTPASDLTLVGSSLGGFYAQVMAEKLGCRAVLLNPSIRAFDTLLHYLGPQTNLYTGEVFEFTAEHVNVLRDFFVPRVTYPERYLLIVETGDEVLDYRAALDC